MANATTATRLLVDGKARRRISQGPADETLFVEAGAGSGKTTLLVERIVHLVLDANVSLRSIAAMTFTEAAASELASRVRSALERELTRLTSQTPAGSADSINERIARCEQAIADTDIAAISTVHGFANRILHEFAIAARLPPKVTVRDEVSSLLAHEQRWQHFVDRLHDTTQHADLLVRASVLGIPLEPSYRGQVNMFHVATEFNQNWDRLDELVEEDFGPLSNIGFEPFDQAVGALEQAAETCQDASDKLYERIVGEILPQAKRICDMGDNNRKLRVIAGLQQSRGPTKPVWTAGSGGRQAAWGSKENKETARESIRALSEALREVVEGAIDETMARLSQLVARETLDAADERRSNGSLEFHDLLVLARSLLRSSEAVRRALHQRYRFIMLDEFQDTDPIQIELAALIASDATSVTDQGWSELPIDPGRLFFVGDPKQSIYRFRRADIALFLKARDRFGVSREIPEVAEPSGLVLLSSNFRTVSPILDWVNLVFAKIMVEHTCVQPKFEPLTANRRGNDIADHRPVLLGGPHPDPKVKAAELRRAEAVDVAQIARIIADDPSAWPVFDKHTGEWRAARLSDITVLIPARSSLPFLRAALDEQDITYRIATGNLVYDTQEVADALAALRAIDDPSDEISLVAALRSPLYACSDHDLALYYRQGGRWDLRTSSAERPSGVASNPVLAGIAHLRSLWELRWWVGPSELLERLLSERQARLLAFATGRPSDVWRRLRFLVDQARLFEHSEGGDLRSFLRWAELQSAPMARTHEPLLPETDEDAMSIQTIHGAKGLEFPIVIMSGMTTIQTAPRSGVNVIWGDDRPQIKLSSSLRTNLHASKAGIEDAMDGFEKLRLAYVAATRARDHLIVSCHHNPGKASSCYGGQIWNALHHGESRSRGADTMTLETSAEAPEQLWRSLEIPAQHEDFTIDLSQAAQDVVANQTATHRSSITDRSATSAQGKQGETDDSWRGLPLEEAEARSEWILARHQLLSSASTSRVISATAIAHNFSNSEHDPLCSGPANGHDLVPSVDTGPGTMSTISPTATFELGRGAAVSAAVGSATHRVLQLIDLVNPKDVGVHARQQCELFNVVHQGERVEALVRTALASEAVSLAVRYRHFKEMYVAAPVGDKAIEGYIDLVIESPEGLVIADYKTDELSGQEALQAKLDKYSMQSAAYAVALEAATGNRVAQCRLVFCSLSAPKEHVVSDLERLKARVHTALTSNPS